MIKRKQKKKPLQKDLYIALHSHRFGYSSYIIRCNRYPSVDEVIDLCNIDFESDREEDIEITSINLKDIKTLK